jgi:acetate kinase
VRVLVVNVGSSSVKLSLLGPHDEQLAAHDIDGGGADAFEALRDLGRGADAVGHRIVHGGPRFTHAVRIDHGVIARLRELIALAPLHQPRAIEGIEAAQRALPGVPEVACFDTAFHDTLPAEARTYAVPREWRKNLGIRRYGFHGLSHAYIARRAGEMTEREGGGRLVSCHLGAGASLAAIRDGVCIDTTMGFTPLEGLVMATRSGTIDPGIVLWLLMNTAMAADHVWDALEHHSGFAGLTGTDDMREVRIRAGRGDAEAREALAVHAHRLAQLIGAMAASLGGLDTIAFTGGVGEHDAFLRAEMGERLGFLGMAVDAAQNAAARGDVDVSAEGADVRTLVVTAREDLEIARQVRGALA